MPAARRFGVLPPSREDRRTLPCEADCAGPIRLLERFSSASAGRSVTTLISRRAPPGLLASSAKLPSNVGTAASATFCVITRSRPEALAILPSMSGVKNSEIAETMLLAIEPSSSLAALSGTSVGPSAIIVGGSSPATGQD